VLYHDGTHGNFPTEGRQPGLFQSAGHPEAVGRTDPVVWRRWKTGRVSRGLHAGQWAMAVTAAGR
ncbi:MAG: hypothetical protein KJN92_16880, partial [Gemmatimonadetes bacterium]|nr:hypothetical protein [Gemmatimonadota bacterium]